MLETSDVGLQNLIGERTIVDTYKFIDLDNLLQWLCEQHQYSCHVYSVSATL